MALASAAMLEVAGMNVVYGGSIHVLHDVSLQVGEGAIVALLGANGAGKTTLLRAVSGLLAHHGGRIASGTVRFEGTDGAALDAASLVRKGLGQVMEGRRIFAELTVEENLRTGAFTRRDKAEVRESHERVMDLFPRLRERRTQVAGYLSGGEQQMLAIGRALMASPRLLLLDEPSLGLAPLIVEQIFGIVAEINRQGTSVLLVEQNAAMALRASSYGYVLENGRIAKHGEASMLLNDEGVRALYLGGASEHTSFRNLKSYRAPSEYVL